MYGTSQGIFLRSGDIQQQMCIMIFVVLQNAMSEPLTLGSITIIACLLLLGQALVFYQLRFLLRWVWHDLAYPFPISRC